MSQFTRNCRVEVIGRNLFQLIEPLEYHVGCYPSEEIIIVPDGFITDFASVPRVFWPIISPIDIHANAAVIHDFMYQMYYAPKKDCEWIFNEAMTVLKVPDWKRVCIYNSVYYFGWKTWISYRLQDRGKIKGGNCYDHNKRICQEYEVRSGKKLCQTRSERIHGL